MSYAITASNSNPVVLEYFRQALDFESPRLGCVELDALYRAAPSPTMAPPMLWKFGAKTLHGTDPLGDVEVVDGKLWADPIKGTDYAIHIGELSDAWDAFHEEAMATSMAETLVKNPSAAGAFFAVAGTLGAYAKAGRPMTPIEAIHTVLGHVREWGELTGGAVEKDTERRLLGAMFGNDIPPTLNLVGA